MRKLLCLLALGACTGPAAPAPDVTLARLELSSSGEAFEEGKAFPQHTSLQLEAFGFFTDGHKVNLTRDAVWTSSNVDTVLVTNEGVAILRGTGTVTVTAAVLGTTQTLALTSNAANVTRVELVGDTRALAKGQVVRLHATASFEDGTSRDVTELAQWGSVNGNATMTEVPGEFVAAREGTATVRAYFQRLAAEQTFTISGPVVEGLFIEAQTSTLHPGDVERLAVAERYSDGSALFLSAECEWLSTDASVLSVSSEGTSRGTLTAHAAGTTTVMAMCGGRTALRTFAVANRVAESLVLSDGLQLAKGGEGQVRVQALWDDGSITEVTEFTQFSSTDVRVATVSNTPGFHGFVRAAGEGTAQIRAIFGEVSAAVQVVTTPPALQLLTSTLSSARMVVNQRATFAVLGYFTDGTTMNLTSAVTFGGAAVSLGNDEAAFIGHSMGSATVRAEVAGHLVAFPVEVTNQVITGLRLERVPNIERPGTERLVAIATWSDGAESDVTELSDWSTSHDTRAVARNNPGARGYVQSLSGGDVTVRCQLGADAATYDLSFPTTP